MKDKPFCRIFQEVENQTPLEEHRRQTRQEVENNAREQRKDMKDKTEEETEKTNDGTELVK